MSMSTIVLRGAVVGFALGAGLVPVALGEAAPDRTLVAQGEKIARLLCPACHVVAKDQQFAPILRQPTPSFAQIANRPDTTAASLQRFITATHWDQQSIPMQMPSPGLSKPELRAVTAYILSLRSP